MKGTRIVPNFLDLASEHSGYETSRYAVLPIPYDRAASFKRGAADGPQAIINASHHLETLDEELAGEFHTAGIATLESVAPHADGPAAMQDAIQKVAKRVVRDGKVLIGLGGDHSVTGGLLRGVMSRHRKLSVLQLDAHLDLRNTFEGSRHSHATVMRRAHEMGAHIVPVGIRSLCAEERGYARRNKLWYATARECIDTDAWIDRVLESLTDRVYVSIDIDAFDPAFAPGTGTPEPGGLDYYLVTSLLRLVAAEKRIVGFDVVEVMPLPGQVVTEYLAARLVYKLVSYIESGAGE